MQPYRDDGSPDVGAAHTMSAPAGRMFGMNARYTPTNPGGGKGHPCAGGAPPVRVSGAAPGRNEAPGNTEDMAALQAAGMALGGGR